MKKRKLGNSDLSVSEMGLGCMSLGTNQREAASIIKAALDAGINYFDTADLYDFGGNEEMVGKTLKSVRDRVIIATKVGNRWNENKDSWSWDPSAAYIKTAVKDSLKRLCTDYIDLYQLHGGTTEDNIEETIAAFEGLKNEGYIRYYGISSIRPNVIKPYVKKASIVSVMMQYSLLDRRPEEWMPLLTENNISIVARGPVAKGLLSDKMLDKASMNVKEQGYLDYSYTELKELLPALKDKLSPRYMNEIALQYVLSHHAVGAVIPGASSIGQLRENCRALNAAPLSEEEITLLKELTKESIYKVHRE
ncbi:aldo/keto reductase [Peribacillus cavernae]|uniref:Aldo/keto reductase n=1 Tax=Peribacillus cavernae TaxID=1674310 RepID=A0A433HDX9_9BACI|nr:aldo/keto reductase [Peribacillus cavernae]MDQ0219070.1 aryl-alcohol dehydrogenase-like predicted oxidoreductase [Peribacillus cavernae]RUQ26522.1 aldo/keto reductase [Peribacillus cavernae]